MAGKITVTVHGHISPERLRAAVTHYATAVGLGASPTPSAIIKEDKNGRKQS